MPVSTEKRPELDLTIFTPTGIPPVDEIEQTLEAFYKESPTVNVMWDCSQLAKVTILNRELQELIQYVKNIHL